MYTVFSVVTNLLAGLCDDGRPSAAVVGVPAASGFVETKRRRSRDDHASPVPVTDRHSDISDHAARRPARQTTGMFLD